MPAPTLIEALLKQEQVLILPAFDETIAYDIGTAIRAEALARKAPVVVEIRTPARRLYFAALPGSSPNNEDWARRKANVVLRCHASSMRVGQELAEKEQAQWPDAALDPKDFAVHGGAFPVAVTGVGVVAVIAVSGLPSRDDHEMITGVLAKRLGVKGVALPGPPQA
jgi:uncharacterized protein (UPF0303 family)